jgi:argininosuccinate synthase
MASAPSIPDSPFPIPDSKDIVLAFSGGLDTSFCIPWLKERGYDVHTVFADTGGVDDAERQYIEQRAAELGASSHVTVDGGPAIWNAISSSPSCGRVKVTKGQYPLAGV